MFESFKGMSFRIFYALSRRWRDRRYILQMADDSKLYSGPIPPEVSIRLFSDLAEIPEELVQQIHRAMGRADYRSEMEQQFRVGGRLCVATWAGEFGSLGWIKAGRDLPNWHIPLEPDDTIFGRDFTAPQMRGRRLHAIVTAARHRAAAGQRYFCDCHIHNISSLRALQRSGWTIVGEVTVLRNTRRTGAS